MSELSNIHTYLQGCRKIRGDGALFVKIGKPYTPQNGKIVDVVGNPVIFTDFGENPMITIGFPHNL